LVLVINAPASDIADQRRMPPRAVAVVAGHRPETRRPRGRRRVASSSTGSIRYAGVLSDGLANRASIEGVLCS
jgi:hypothetical protein